MRSSRSGTRRIPAVIYGGKDVTANLEVAIKDIESLLAHAVGEHSR